MSLKLNGATSGYVEIDAPAVAGSTSITLPATSGGEFIVSDASGNIDLGALDISGSAAADSVNIDASGRLLVGTSSSIESTSKLQVKNGYLNLYHGDSAANSGYGIKFSTDGGATARTHGQIDLAQTAGNGGTLKFSTTADGASIPTERVRITSTGATLIGSTNVSDGERLKVESSGAGNSTAYFVYASSDDRPVVMSYHAGSTGATSRKHYEFRNSAGAEVGSIAATGTATSYNTSSDYRLKENIVALSGAIDRVNQLQVHRFNFISDPDTTVDGFIAHEAQAVVPECVTGEKDAVDENGNPVYQGIDQSKLVPLLTAALQEALAKIETLEQRLNDAGIA